MHTIIINLVADIADVINTQLQNARYWKCGPNNPRLAYRCIEHDMSTEGIKMHNWADGGYEPVPANAF